MASLLLGFPMFCSMRYYCTVPYALIVDYGFTNL